MILRWVPAVGQKAVCACSGEEGEIIAAGSGWFVVRWPNGEKTEEVEENYVVYPSWPVAKWLPRPEAGEALPVSHGKLTAPPGEQLPLFGGQLELF